MGRRDSTMDDTAQQDDLQSARLRDLGIGVTPNEQVRPKFRFTDKNLRANGFKEKTKPMGFFTCLALGFLLYLFMVCGWNVIQLRHPMDARSLEQVLGSTAQNATAEDLRNLLGIVDFVQLFHRAAELRLAPSGEFAGEQLALGTSSAFGSQYVMHRFLGDGAGDWAGKVFPDESDTESNTGINVFEDDEHEQRSGGGDERTVRAIPFEFEVMPSVVNAQPVTHITYTQDPRAMFRNMFEEVVCLHDDLCIGLAGFGMIGGLRNGWPFLLYRGAGGHRLEKEFMRDGL